MKHPTDAINLTTVKLSWSNDNYFRFKKFFELWRKYMLFLSTPNYISLSGSLNSSNRDCKEPIEIFLSLGCGTVLTKYKPLNIS